ncbi:MAG: hypothetical protein HS127_16530 [Planctomycetia bacterium]|nr:hypothetical protein [Planctomycetia bacterium]
MPIALKDFSKSKTLFPQDPEIEAKARHYASQIRQERLDRAQERITGGESAGKNLLNTST